MTSQAIEPAIPSAPRGEVHFVRPGEIAGLRGTMLSAGLLVVTMEPLGPGARGRLREAIEAAVEAALERRGAAPPGIDASSDLDASLSDQLYRARLVGARGIALHLGPLSGAANLAGALDAEDSAVLRWWLAATRERPVVLLLDDSNRSIGAYGPPTRLDALMTERAAEPPVSREKPVSAQVEAAPPPAVSLVAEPEREREADGEEERETEHHREHDHDHDHDREHDRDRDHDHDHDHDRDRDREHDRDPPPDLDAAPARPLAPVRPIRPGLRATAPSSGTLGVAPEVPSAPLDVEPRTIRIAAAMPARSPDAADAEPRADAGEWRAWAAELEAARGPKPLAAIERLFVSRYVPLAEAAARGEVDASARATLASWAASFAKSYTEAFGALRVTGKRPMMVLDVPQLASRIARLHGAKSTQLVLVDAMRFDLGLRVHDRMRKGLGGDAACTERLLLWTALPSTTPTQMDLLARGPEGLAARGEPSEREEVARGRNVSSLRRIRIGQRDVLKLDVAEARLREAGPRIPERLDAIADEVSRALVAHGKTLQPRTLMFVFGDHGFRLEPTEDGTGQAFQGGATPDEVLVPAFAWMVGGVH